MAKKKSPPVRRTTKKSAAPAKKKASVRVPRKVARKMAKEIAAEIETKAERVVASKIAAKVEAEAKAKKKKSNPKSKPLSESVPIESLDAAVDQREELESLCSTYRQMQNDIDDLNAAREALYPAIEALAREMGVTDTYREGAWRLVLAQGRSVSLSKERLVELGVSLDTIEAAKKESRWEKYQVLIPKADSSTESGEE